jgi:hypothetical protein
MIGNWVTVASRDESLILVPELETDALNGTMGGGHFEKNGRSCTCCQGGRTGDQARKGKTNRLTGQAPHANWVTAPEAWTRCCPGDAA